MIPSSSHTLHQNSNTSTSTNSYVELGETSKSLTPHEIYRLRQLLHASNSKDESDADSEYSEFPETTHAWAVFADKPQRKATKTDRLVGTGIILFQLFTYTLFVVEALEDYQRGSVTVMTPHDSCLANDEQIPDNTALMCEAEVTNHFDACVSFFMLAIFLTPEILQALRAIRAAPLWTGTFFFACVAGIEVVYAFIAATIAISYHLHIGEVTDAIEVGVGLLFVRELSARAYHGIRHKGIKQYKAFFSMLVLLLVVGFMVEALCEAVFGGRGR